MDQMAAPLTLAIDVGGSRLKAGVLSRSGEFVTGPERVDTPRPATPDAVIAALEGLARPLGSFQRISIGFPGVVRHGKVMTAPNLGTEAWGGVPLASRLSQMFGGAPARLANDATVQGLGVIAGQGLECVITLGTGMGFAVFEDGRPAPHLELSQHPVHADKTYDRYVGNAAMRKAGNRRWNRRVRKAIGHIATLTNFDMLYIGGGNARHLAGELPDKVRTVSNVAGITGGVRIWDSSLDAMFTPA